MSIDDFGHLKLKEVMQKPVTLNEKRSVDVAYIQLSASPEEMVGVVDDDGKLVGTVTKSKLMEGMFDHGIKKEDRVDKAMYKNPFTIEDEKTVDDAIQKMNENKVDKLPVVDKDGKIVGTVSRKELLKKAGSYLKFKL
jgi:IMP dehydrogenase